MLAFVTVNAIEPETAPEEDVNVAVMVAWPAATPCTVLPETKVMTEPVVSDVDQATCDVMLCVLPSENVPVAVSWTLLAGAIGVFGPITIELKFLASTVTALFPETELKVAEIVTGLLVTAFAETRPVPVTLTV
jgi:hypothetical protein